MICAGSQDDGSVLKDSTNRASMMAFIPVSLGFTWGSPALVVWRFKKILPRGCWLLVQPWLLDALFVFQSPSGSFVKKGFGVLIAVT